MNELKYRLQRFLTSLIKDIRILSLMDDLLRVVLMPLGFVVYVITTRVLGRPYFGLWLCSGQGSPLRYPYMRAAVKSCVAERETSSGSPFRVMEIGAYAGASAIQFAEALCETEANRNSKVFSVDPWDAYLDVTKNNRLIYRIMNYNLASGNVLRLFVRNLRAAGISNMCSQIRGRSEDVLPMLTSQQFDFIYIDGDHAPDAVLRDLKASARLLRAGGYLCGDDLELQMADLDHVFVEENVENDIALDPASGKVFHPGVAFAVNEFFGRPITSYDGFWVVRWTGETYEDVVLDDNS